ncbi:karyopherin Kap109 [Paraphysoderma sedebokerense]|nr:karyopherin Kap109 [Paraphysoderma sedebokerense]
MEASDANVALLANYIAQTFNPATSKQAEQALHQAQEAPGFANVILKLVQSQSHDNHTRLSAALLFKNFIKKNWELESKITPDDRAAAKNQIVDIMISVPSKLQVQLSEALTVIADHDFPEKWENLIDELVRKLTPQDFNVNNGILQTAHSIFKRWRHQFRSDALFTEIQSVIDRFAAPFLELVKVTDSLIDQNANNKAMLDVLLQSLLLETKVFYSFNCQDIPVFFEDHQQEFMSVFHKYLLYQNPLLVADRFHRDDTNISGLSVSVNQDEAGPLEKVKTSVCEIIDLYTQRYEDVFPMLPQFVETVWNVLTNTSMDTKNDLLVSHAIAFLTSVVKQPRHQAVFSSPETLASICEKVIVPNMMLRESDVETFEDDPIEFIRRDLEGSDSDTRRRSASDFVKSLLQAFPEQVTSTNLTYINGFLQKYQANPAENWQQKDVAIALFISIASESHVITQAGATSTRLNVVEFFSSHVFPDLQAPMESSIHPILRVDAIKFLYNFRNQLSKDLLLQVFPLLLTQLKNPNYVVHTYSAICVEKILAMKGTNHAAMFSAADVKPYSEALLTSLFQLLKANPSPEKLSENDYLMRSVMRVIATSKAEMLPYATAILTELNNFLGIIAKNPSNPRFYHYIFEAIASLIRNICPVNPSSVQEFEALLFPTFQNILVSDVSEFMPYVFQVLAQMLECHHDGDLPATFQAVLPPLLAPSLWESSGNVPALLRLLQAFLSKGAKQIVANNQLTPILGIFQKLISSKLNDQHGFDLLKCIVRYVDLLQQSKTSKFVYNFATFVSFFVALEKENVNPQFVIDIVESIQPGLYLQLHKTFVLPEVKNIVGRSDRRIVGVAFTKLLTMTEYLLQDLEIWFVWWFPMSSIPVNYTHTYVPINTDRSATLFAAIEHFKNSAADLEKADAEEDQILADLEETGYQATYSKLSSVGAFKIDPCPNVTDARGYFTQRVQEFVGNQPGKIQAIVQNHVPADIMQQLQNLTGNTAPLR